MKKGVDYKTATDLIGTKMKTTKQSSSGRIPAGSIITISKVSMGSPDYFYSEEHNSNCYWTPSALEILPLTVENLKEMMKKLDKNINALRTEKDALNMKIKFMKENKLEEYDEDQYKAYAILQSLKSAGTDLEKAKLIASIVKS